MSNTETLDMARRFPVPTLEEWEKAAQAELKDTPLAKLTRRNLEGVEVRPLYPSGRDACPLPFAGPAWTPQSPDDASAAIEPGAPLLAVPLDLDEGAADRLRAGLAAGETAVALRVADSDPHLLKEVLAGQRAAVLILGSADPLPWLQALLDAAEPREGALFCDPLSRLAQTGFLSDGLDRHFDRMAEAVRLAGSHGRLSVLGIDAGIWHEAGADAAQQLGWALATGVETVRALTSRGLALQDVLDHVAFAFAVSPRLFPEMARLRAARRLWARVADLLGGTGATRVVVHSGRVHRSGWDPYTNLIRSTVEAFAAISGGADAVLLDPMDLVAGNPDARSCRHARNQVLVLLEEGQLHRVLDPGAGSGYLESLTDEVARLAWTHLQEIEAAGGMTAALRAGIPQKAAAATAEKRAKALATGRASMVGVSQYGVRAEPPSRTSASQAFDIPEGAAEKVTPVCQVRLAEGFEALRLRTWMLEQKLGRPVTALMASLGGSGMSRIRAQFCSTFLGAGGLRIESPAGFGSVAEALAEARRQGADAVVLCAEDPQYAELLQALPAERPLIGIAGFPADRERLQELGADFFIHKDADRVGTTADLLGRLEVTR